MDSHELALIEIHRTLFPERYEDVPLYEWDAETPELVAQIVERALPDAPKPAPENRSAAERADALAKDQAGRLAELGADHGITVDRADIEAGASAEEDLESGTG